VVCLPLSKKNLWPSQLGRVCQLVEKRERVIM